MKYEYCILLSPKDGTPDIQFVHIELDVCTLEDINDAIEQLQKVGKIPYNCNLISISLMVIN